MRFIAIYGSNTVVLCLSRRHEGAVVGVELLQHGGVARAVDERPTFSEMSVVPCFLARYQSKASAIRPYLQTLKYGCDIAPEVINPSIACGRVMRNDRKL